MIVCKLIIDQDMKDQELTKNLIELAETANLDFLEPLTPGNIHRNRT